MLRRANGLSLALIASVCAVGAEAKECKLEEAIQAETEASSLQTWAEVFESYRRYRQCDDAAISEGYSAAVAALVADQWDRVQELRTLVREHPGFQAFVLRHLNETMSADQYKVIRENVQHHCPATAMKLCAAIEARLEDDEAG